MVRGSRITMNNPPPIHVRTDKLFGGVSRRLLRHFTFGGQADTKQKAKSLFKITLCFLCKSLILVLLLEAGMRMTTLPPSKLKPLPDVPSNNGQHDGSLQRYSLI